MKRREIKQYEFIRKIGTGGSGVVYLANDTLLQRPVVLKLLKRGSLTIEQMRTTQLREARLASAIDHPNVCAIYDVGEAPAESGGEDEAYIVMQYIPGKSLDKLIAEGPASLQLVLSAGIQTSDGKVHEADVIILAVGFDAGSGALSRIDIRGRDGRSLKDRWKGEIRTAMGLQVHGYPNLFTTGAPLAPSAAQHEDLPTAGGRLDHRLHRPYAGERQKHRQGDRGVRGQLG